MNVYFFFFLFLGAISNISIRKDYIVIENVKCIKKLRSNSLKWKIIQYLGPGVKPGIFVWGPSCNTNIFIKTISYSHINTHAFFYYIHKLFYLISYIYTHTQQKKSLIFSIKIMFDGYLS